MKIEVKYTKLGMIKFISHLDTMRLFQRAIRRLRLQIRFSQGFNPHMMISLANPLALGVESEHEYLIFETVEDIPLDDLAERLNSELPKGVNVFSVREIEEGSKTEQIEWSLYEFNFLNDYNITEQQVLEAIVRLLAMEEIIIEKRMKRKGKKVMGSADVREFIKSVELKEIKDKEIIVNGVLKSGNTGGLNPVEFSKIFNGILKVSEDINSVNIVRKNQYSSED